MHRRCLAAVLCLSLLGISGCLLPNTGTQVFVDQRTGSWWSGRGMLIEVSDDQQRCHVAVRDRALVVKRKWVECRYVHPRKEP